MFADDASVSCSHENPVDFHRVMNGSLELLRRWFIANKLTLTLSLPTILLSTVLRNSHLEEKGCPDTYERRDYEALAG